MKDKFKSWMIVVGILGVLLGRIINRILSNYFGDSASNIVVAIAAAIMFCVILLAIVMAQYITAIMLFIMTVPLIIGGIGLYLDNTGLLGIGILSIFIIYPIEIKVMSMLKQDNKLR